MCIQAIKSIDLRGVPCPLSFVRAKLHLEKLESGQLLEVLLDGGEPIEQVPNSLISDGHQVKGIEERDRFFALTVQKA
ncbi:sulfurtransferase TusA family protein [Pseudanabaena sp. BC1403]|uniref:sulfurtransferase TusA family protein n=1 Tax=Pseudanabaena sp. BC1403 TaxID=2043171 RepID=UPI000CD9A899|nr:sulfurtransferase TusA family protein [Pseudanabaena sp. BC1403]